MHLAVSRGLIDIIKLLVADPRININVEDEILIHNKSSLISILMILNLIIFEENQLILQEILKLDNYLNIDFKILLNFFFL